jgi:outer membrane lipoprotein
MKQEKCFTINTALLITLLFTSVFLLSGCAHVISKELRDRADRGIPLSSLFEEPGNYKGRIVVIGGIIANTSNEKEVTYIEVVQQTLDYLGRPVESDTSSGRFLILYEGFLDPVIYSRGRKITVAGEVLGKKVRPIGETVYSYLLVKSIELHVTKPGDGFPILFGIGLGVAVD